jgi:fatty acid desaturase
VDLAHDRAESQPPLLKERLRQLHRPHWSATVLWFGFLGVFIVALGLLVAAMDFLPPGPLQIAVCTALVLVVAHLMHAHLIAFHEAAHGLLCPARWLNDQLGSIIGLLSFMSLSLYRAAHHSHHAWLATERDEELWPFVETSSPRWLRRLAAWAELTCGLVYTPMLFLRAFLRPGTVIRSRAIRRRIWAELSFEAVAWTTILAAVAWFDLWVYFLVTYLAPAVLAGNMQSWRKYVEHMGLTGAASPLGATRSVHTPGWLGGLVSFSLMHEPYHGVHHKYARLPHGALPLLSDELMPEAEGETLPFPTYRAALADMVRTLGDPRVGPQWRRGK